MSRADRNEKGQFVKGNKGGPGRPTKKVEEAYLDVLYDVVSLEDWREILEEAASRAKEGDEHARRWLGRWLIDPVLRVREKETDLLEALKQSWPRKE